MRPGGGLPTPRILLEGRPGVGKTTAALRVAELLRTAGLRVRGFVTEELRESGVRVGFAIETLEGRRGILAHVELRGPPRVGKYGVDLAAFERLALPALSAGDDEVVIVDELGKMELSSDAFRTVVMDLFARRAPVVATVHAFAHPFTDALKRRADVTTLPVTRRDRDELPERVAALVLTRRA